MQTKLRVLVVLAAFLLCATSVFAYVQESETYYHDKLFDKTFNLTPSVDEIVVIFEQDADFDAFQAEFGFIEAQSLDKEKRIGVYKIPTGSVIGQAIDQVVSSDHVVKAAPAYIDQEDYTKYCVPTELTVQFNNGVSENRMLEIIAEVGSEIVRKQWTPGYFTISAPGNKGYFETIRKLYTYREVVFSEPSIISYNDEAWTPNDTHFGSQWALNNTGQNPSCSGCSPYNDHDIDAVSGWDTGRGDPNVVVVIIDTGMDLTHPDLAGNLLPRNGHDWDFADPYDSSPDDTGDHGTACSGIAAAVANNSLGVAGAANLCRIMPLRINLTSGYNQNRADAINYATTRRIDFDGLVLSNSWIMSSGDYVAVHNAIVNANSSDVLVVFAAGNANGSVQYPAIYPEAMAIAATSPCDERKSPTSCDGETWWGSNYGSQLDCAAPGVNIYTTDRQGSAGYDPGDYTSGFNGTSSACPLVAGVAAAVWANNTSLTNTQVRNAINQSADQVGGYYYSPTTGKSSELGHGRVNFNAALIATTSCGQDSITIAIYTDNYPTETTWQIVDQSSGDTIATGGPYSLPQTLYTTNVCIPYYSCNDFTIFDTFGDGICCLEGNGYYNIYYNGNLVASGGQFTYSETVNNIGGCQTIPTLSEWGMIILSLLLLTSGTVAVIRKKKLITERA